LSAIRRAGEADVDALLALWAVARTPHAVTSDSADAVVGLLGRSAVFLADGGSGAGALTGAIIAGWDGWRGNLYRLAVLPAGRRDRLGARRRGLARRAGSASDQRAGGVRRRRGAGVLGVGRLRRRRRHRAHGARLIVRGVKTARNVAIILALAALVTLAPAGLTARDTISNIISVIFLGGLGFFAYRMYMENRTTLFDLPEQRRLLLYGSATTLAFALIATRRFWDSAGPAILLWFALIAVAAYGFAVVIRAWREY
jgi:hypothetical protein